MKYHHTLKTGLSHHNEFGGELSAVSGHLAIRDRGIARAIVTLTR
jgi:hypothetical protein